MYRLTFFIFSIALTFINLHAQQRLTPTVMSTGGGFSGDGSYTLSFTVGEPFVKTISSSSIILTEGFQQGKFFSNNPLPVIDTKVYPNPALNKLYVNIKVNETDIFYLKIYSLTGKVILIKEYSGYTSDSSGGYYDVVDVSHLVKGLYLIKIESLDGSLQRTYKIEKL